MLSTTIYQFASLFCLAILPSAFAVPDVTVTPLLADCSSYPQYDASTKTAGPWLFQIISSDNSSIEGYAETSRQSSGSIPWAYLVIPSDFQEAKRGLRCSNGSLEGLWEAGWLPLTVAPIPHHRQVVLLPNGAPIKPFVHTVDGVKQDAVFVGGFDNVTTWGVRYMAAAGHFELRLLGPDSQDPATGRSLYPDEFTAFLKIHV